MKAKNLIGERFGRLKVIELNPERKGGLRQWDCVCECGKPKTVLGKHLLSGGTQSCGCLRDEILVNNSVTHGMEDTATYRTWQMMKTRCTNPNMSDYPNYGGRGIKVCERWQKFENFLEDMGERPEGTTLDRIDVDGDYKPSNCRWATKQEQANNTRRSRLITYQGKTQTVKQWSDYFGVPYPNFYQKLKRLNWSLDTLAGIFKME